MSFVLKLDVETAATSAVENTTKDTLGSEGQSPPTLVFAREIWRSQEPVAVATGTITTTGNAVVIASGDDTAAATNSGKSQLLQCLEAANNQEPATTVQVTVTTASTLTTVKPVVTYPVAKGAREQVQRMIASSQTNNTEVLTTRVISQKPPSSIDQAQPVPVTLNTSCQTSTNSTSLPSPSSGILCPWQATMTTVQSSTQPIYQSKNQVAITDLIHCSKQQQVTTASNVQATLHHKLQPIYSMSTSTTAVKAVDLQRYHTKSLPGSIISTSQSAQKIKTMTNVITNPSTIVAQRNNSLSKSQGAPKTRVLPGQFINNQATVNNSASSQKIQGNSTIQKTTQPVNVTNVQKTTLQSVCNNQKIPVLSGNHLPNLKAQQQGIQKLHVPQKISLAMGRQQFQPNTQQINNVAKSSGLVTGIQKYQSPGQHYMACQQAAISQARSQPMTTGLQKSQTTVQTTKLQTATSNVCKSNSVPNVSKPSQNSNVLTIGKQQSQVQSTSTQLLQGSQQVIQKSQQQQSTNANNVQIQRSHSITNVHSKVITSIPSNQRTPVVMNSKVQQQQQQQQTVMRVGISKNQTQGAQTVTGLKTSSQKPIVKATANSQNNVIQQPILQRNNNPPQSLMKVVQQQQQQQQQQNVIGPQNAPQKQPGCIKTIPPQKSVQRNHAQKISNAGVKPLLNPNVTGFTKAQGPTQVAPKTSIKTLLPQQTVIAPSNVIVPHKNSPIKIQQQAIQQKQLVMTPQYTQQIRQQTGQIKTLLPITSATIEPRKDLTENKNDNESRMSKEEEQSTLKSPVRRMPLPYECLQFVLQDHNYGAPPPRTPPPPPSSPPHPKQQPINGVGSSTATSQHPYIFGPVVSNTNVEDDAASAISSEAGREAEPEGEETETAPEGEGDDEDSVTRCICDFEHDDGYMICCDRCLVWQHVDCMGIDRSNIPDEYLCERCRPRRVDRQRARALQMRKREELLNSDTSSDTSSTSSADTDVGSVNNASTQKKRSLSQQQSQVPRRNKSDASAQSSQVRRLNNNNNNNNNVGKRQRRDSQARQSSTVRKKENTTSKRGPGKRKTKRRTSLEDKEEDVQDAWGTNMTPLRQWIERYEEAVTNHYSPELRARISNIKVNGTHSDLRQSNMNVVATGKCRLNVHSNNLKFLVATMYLPPNTPVVELRGKYMLSTQHRLQYTQSGRQHVQRPGPFVFFYRLPRDGTEVCVDTRTYGNEARFVRRSCKPNAEVKHCIEKGTLHLYIVTICAIEKNAEITIKHEQHDLLLSPNSNSPALPVACACNNPRECQIANAASQLNRRGSNGALVENADGRERRRRGRRNTVCEETDSTPPAAPPTSVTQTTTTTTTSSVSSAVTPATPRRAVTTTVTTTTTRQVAKEDTTTTTVTNTQPQTSPSLSHQSVPTTPETKKDKKKMTREERKMEAIMKAFERLEKAEQRKQEVQARNAQRKESGGTHSDNEDNNSTTGQSKNSKQASSERPLRRRRRKGRARTTSSSQSQSSSRRTRLNSAESDVSSGDESNSMQSPPLLSQNRPPSRDAPYSSHLHTPAKNTTGDVNTGSSSGSHQGIPTAAGLLLALANSNAPGPPSSPPLQQPTPVKSPTCDSGASSSSQSSTPSTPLSSACLLVAAAVGPLAPGFKFPKTKKVLMNEWLKESPDPPQANISQVSPLPALPPAGPSTLQNSMNPLCGRHFPSVPTDASADFLSQSYAAKSLATLVQAANSVGGICDSPPQRRQQQQASGNNNNNNNNNNGNGGCPAVSTGSAKKRWLRQAISEECDSPNSRPESPPSLSETVAPPKKRRIARESLSSDNYTPPTTPTMLLPTEAAPNSRSLCQADDDYTEHVQSPIVEQMTDERHYDLEAIKEEIKMDDRSIDSDKPVAQEKLSSDVFPQTELYIKCEEKTEISDSVKTEVFKMDTETITDTITTKKEKVSPKWEGDDIKCNYDQLNQKIIEKIRETVEKVKKESFVKEEIVTKGTVEIIDQNEPDTEMEELSSPIATIEPDAILKQRVVEMQLEFGGSISEIVNIVSSEYEKSNDEKKQSEVAAKCQEVVEKSDDNASIDEFDVEAQMKKITGDDGNDYQEKIDTSSEKDKSMDGIEGLMESSKEDSDSEDKDVDDDKYCESSFKLFDTSHEEASFKESDTKLDTKLEQIIIAEDDTKETDKSTSDKSAQEISKAEQSSTFVALSEESIFESASTNMDAESIADPPKIFHSIPPLSERIRKKTDPSTTKTPKMDFEAAIIESTISMDVVDGSKNGEQKSMLSTALRELLEAKLDDEPTGEVIKNDIDNEINASPQVIQPKSDSSEHSLDTIQDSASTQQAPKPEETPAKEDETKPKEIKRLKDPRTVVPNSMPAPAFKPDALPPVKRKLSISEYRKRKQQSSGGTGTEPESSNDTSTTDKSGARGRSDSASSGTSSLSSDEEGSKASLSLDVTGFNALTLFPNANENDDKKGGEEGAIGWSAAPTLVERQRENLTERLKREFGLFLSDDEEERARKHGLTAEAILKAHKSPPPNLVASVPSGYPALPQLPPQPYIPPPGSAPIHYPQFQSKPGSGTVVQYSNFAIPPSTTSQQSVYSTAAPSQTTAVGKQTQQTQFLVPQVSSVPQAPPGSNPYPPQFVPPPTPPATGTTVPISKFSSVTPTPPPPGTQVSYPPAPSGQPQKPFFNQPVPRS